MISNYTIITIPQWAIFASVTIIIYGWIEKKRIFETIGLAILVLLGVFAGLIILSGSLIPEEYLNAIDPVTGEEIFLPDELPVEGRLLPHYWGLLLTGVLSLAALIAGVTRRKSATTLKVIAGSVAIIIFFLMISVLKT